MMGELVAWIVVYFTKSLLHCWRKGHVILVLVLVLDMTYISGM